MTSAVTTLDNLGVDLAVTAFAAEHKFVAAGFFHPVRFHNMAFTHGLAGRRYANFEMSLIHAYLCSAAEHDVTPTMQGYIDVVDREFGVGLDVTELYTIIMADDVKPDDIDAYGAEVSRLCEIRETGARKHLAAAAAMMVDSDLFEVVVRPKRSANRQTHVPDRLRRRRATRAV